MLSFCNGNKKTVEDVSKARVRSSTRRLRKIKILFFKWPLAGASVYIATHIFVRRRRCTVKYFPRRTGEKYI